MNATDIPSCECGCGGSVALARDTDRSRGYVKGRPRRFVQGHNTRLRWAAAQARFWAAVERSESSTCLLWTGHRSPTGYGRFQVDGRHVQVHRYAYEQSRGEIPPGMVCHHRCGNRACVHPLHLTLLTPAKHSRHHRPRSATCVRCGGSDWRDLPSGKRECRPCAARRKREQYARTTERGR